MPRLLFPLFTSLATGLCSAALFAEKAAYSHRAFFSMEFRAGESDSPAPLQPGPSGGAELWGAHWVGIWRPAPRDRL